MITFHNMTAQDIPEFTGLYIDAFNFGEDPDRWDEKSVYRRFSAMLSRESEYGLVMKQDGMPVGIAVGYEDYFDDGTLYFLEEILIGREYQAQGFGTMLMEELGKKLKERGIGKMIALTLNDERHMKYYGNCGFRERNDLVLIEKRLVSNNGQQR